MTPPPPTPSPPSAEALLAEQDFVRGVVRSLLRGDDGDDVVQNTWLRAIRRPLPAVASLRPWLARVVRNLVRDGHREGRRREARERVVARDEALPSTLDVLAREAERQRVVDAVLSLPEPYRSTVLARYWDDVPAARLAERLGLPGATVRSHLRRGLAMLRDRLGGAHEGGRWRAALMPLLGVPTGSVRAFAPSIVAGGLVFSKTKLTLACGLVVLLGVAFWSGSWSDGTTPSPFPSEPASRTRQVALDVTQSEGPTPPADETTTRTEAKDIARTLAIEVVLTQDGFPVPNRALELQIFDALDTAGEPARTQAFRTDAHGRAELREPVATVLRTIRVVASAPACRIWCSPLVVTPDEAHIELRVTATSFDCTLSGFVRDEHGDPIGGATVSFSGWHEAHAGVDGSYELPIGSGAGSRPIFSYAPGYRATLQSIAVPPGASDHVLDLVLLPGVCITGRVVDENRQPVVDAKVQASGSFQGHTSGADGRFVLESLEPGNSHEVRAEKRGQGTGAVFAKAGDEVEVVLTKGLGIAGRVLDPQGKPVAGAAIGTCKHSSGVVVRGWSELDGRFAIDGLQAGKLELTVRRRGYAHVVVPLDVQGDITGLLVDLNPGRHVSGRVLDQHGEPLGGVSVYANFVRDVNARTIGSSIHTDAEGRFELLAMPMEPCTLHAWKAGWQPVRTELPSGADIDLDLRLEPAATIAGRVLDAATRLPLTRFSVRATSSTVDALRHGEALGFEADDGTWRINESRFVVGLELDVLVRAAGYGPARSKVTAAVDPDPDRCVVLLSPAIVLLGTVRDAVSGEAIAGAELSLHGSDEGGVLVTTDEQGRFRLTDLGAGQLSLLVRAPDHPVAVHGPFEVSVGPGTQEIEIRVGRGVDLRGRLDGFGDLIAPRLHIYFADDAHRAQVDADGAFEFPRLGPGRRTLYLIGGEESAVVRNWHIEVHEHEPEAIVLHAREGDGTLSVTVNGLAEGHARIDPLGTPRVPVSLAQHHRSFVGGGFRIEGLAPGRYRVRVSGDGRSATAEVDVDGAAALTIDVPR